MKLLFLRLLNKIGLLKYLILNIRVNIYSNKFKIPIIRGIGLRNMFTTELWMMDLLNKLIPISDDGIFMDVGVNIGQTLLKLKSLSKDYKYVGFEPNPSAMFYSTTLIKANLFKNTSLYPIGLSNKTEVLTLKIYSDNEVDASASILEGFRASDTVKEEKNVPVFNLNEVESLKYLNSKVSFLKIDVEGAELEVIQGLSTTLQRSNPFILIEILPAYNKKNTYRIERQNQIEEIIKSFNYSIYRIIKNVNDERIANYEYIDNFGIHDDLNKCDYILVPKNKTEVFNKLTK